MEQRLKEFCISRSLADEQASEYDKKKKQFYQYLDNFSKKSGTKFDSGFRYTFYNSGVEKYATIKKVQSVQMIFDAEKLEKRIPKKVAEKVIRKKVVVSKIKEFIDYLKYLEADPEIIKSYLSVEKEVDKKSLENECELGNIALETLEGCYDTKTISEYYKITEKEANEPKNDDASETV